MPGFERLSVADLMMLRPEDFGWREDIGAVAVLEPGGLLPCEGPIRVDAVRQHLARRLSLAPRFRRVLRVPGWGLGDPCWVDAVHFDIADHVHVLDLPPDAGEPELLAQIEQLRIRPFDRSRPLWELWFLPGLRGGRVGLYVKMHHAMADATAGVLLLGAFLDVEAAAPAREETAWAPRPEPTWLALLMDNVRRRTAAAARRIAHPIAWARELSDEWHSMRAAFGQEPVPATSISQLVGEARGTVLVSNDLELVKQAAHEHGATVNDVLLAAVAGGYRELLIHRGEPVDGVVFRASVPVSLQEDAPDVAAANADGTMFASLPLGVSDPAARVELIAAETRELKERVYRPPSGAVIGSHTVQRAMWRRFKTQRWANAYVADVVGPPVPLYLAGARIETVFPMVPIIGNVTIGVGALSYAGLLNVTVVADAAACPDVDVFASGLREAIADIQGLRRLDGRR